MRVRVCAVHTRLLDTQRWDLAVGQRAGQALTLGPTISACACVPACVGASGHAVVGRGGGGRQLFPDPAGQRVRKA